MKTYRIQWGRNDEPIGSPGELNELLDRIWSQPGDDGAPFAVTVYNPRIRDPEFGHTAAVHAGIGDPRGLGWAFSDRGDAYEPGVPAPADTGNEWDWSWDTGGQRGGIPVWRIRLTHDKVRAVLSAFLTGAEVPGVEWGLEEPADIEPVPSPQEWNERVDSINELGEASPHYRPPVMPRGPGPLAPAGD